MVEIKAPNKGFCGVRFGIPFHMGTALAKDVDENIRERFTERGYVVSDIGSEAQPAKTTPEGQTKPGQTGNKASNKGR